MAKNSAASAYEDIEAQILSGRLRPAERLVESTLAENLKASRHYVRTALVRLSKDGLVEIEQNKGARVSALTLRDVVDMFVAREGLEAEIVRLAARSITENQLERLNSILQAMRSAFESGQFDEYSELNKAFHQVIYAAAGNDTLAELITRIRLRLARLNMRIILLPGRGDSSLGEHSAIYHALAQRDSQRAVRAIRKHISAVRKDIENGWDLIK